MNKNYDNVEEIKCPHCGVEQGIEPVDSGLVTYWGEESVEWECGGCGMNFVIQECVSRNWDVAKTLDDL